jgi:hypothetical protein
MRRNRWLALAALLFGSAAVLLALAEDSPAPVPRREVVYPQSFDDADWKRQGERATLALPPAPGSTPAPEPSGPGTESGLRDPFLVSLPVKEGGLVMVFEANALRHSRLGERFIACLEARHPGDLAEFQRESGIDPLKDLDRVAFLDNALVLSGHFQNARWDQLGSSPVAYGRAGRIWRDDGAWIAAWGDRLVIMAETEDDARRAIDQLEGRAPVPDSSLGEDLAYGEVYGIIPGASARRLLGSDERAIGSKLEALARRVELHVDAMDDIAAVVRVQGDDRGGVEDLAKTIGATLAVARMNAQAGDDRVLADLLDSAEVRLEGGGFTVQFAVPADRLEQWFADCERQEPATTSPGEPGADPEVR